MNALMERVFGKFDRAVFYPTVILFALVFLVIIVAPDAFKGALGAITQGLIFNVPWLFLWGGAIIFGFCIWVAFSQYGSIKLGGEDEEPAYDFVSWVAMMFSAGLGLTALLWACAEPLYHLFQSSHTIDAGTAGKPQGIPMATMLTVWDWGLHCWAFFTIGALAIALPAYRKDKPMTLSIGLYGLLGEKTETSIWGKLTNILGVIATLGGNSVSIGLGLSCLTYGMSRVFGLEVTMGLKVGVLILLITGFTLSAVSGIRKGIKILSNFNIYLSFAFLLFLIVFGETKFLINLFTQVTGQYLDHFLTLTLWTDAANFVTKEDGSIVWEQRSWLNWWEIFYWLWWISYIPFCSGFIARISRGRTIKEFVTGSILAPTMVVLLIVSFWGGTSAFLQTTGADVELWDIARNNFGDVIYSVLENFPMSGLAIFMMFLSLTIYGITTSDSAAYFLAMQTSGGDKDPKLPMRVLWGCLLGGIGLALLLMDKMKILQSMAIVCGAPFFFVAIAYMISIYKMLKNRMV
ncbi:MAG: BCCT family transporter [Desulfobacterales bacterium]|nr:BCCT family transporter [Desulfobacterales bacterium]